jgi:hypothetical protein
MTFVAPFLVILVGSYLTLLAMDGVRYRSNPSAHWWKEPLVMGMGVLLTVLAAILPLASFLGTIP